VGYFPDMSSQAAAQGYFADLVRQAIASAPIAQRPTGGPLFFDVGNVVVPANGQLSVAPNLGGRGIVGVLATWNATNVVNNAPRAVITGSNFTLFNTNALDANVFWVAIAA
jgi:hypothetical protein